MSDEESGNVEILLVDDRQENLIALEGLLRSDGIGLLMAHSGQEALELLLQHDVALALIDVQMPGMDGFELAELMRGIQRTRRVPIIFLTAANTSNQRRFRGYEAGAVDFLQKPIESDVLRSKAQVFIELYRQRQEVARQRDELKAAMEENSRLLAETRQYAEALRLADRRKDEFLATLAHELRNPLAPILNAVQILQLMTPTADDFPRLRDMIDRQVHHIVRLVDDLLDVGRITQGKIQLQTARINLVDAVRFAIETNEPLLKQRRHELQVHLSADELLMEGDIVRLTQILANLLNNAAKYTPEGGVITVRMEQENGWAMVRVRDTGVGIPAEMRDTIFDMFTQIRQHRDQALGGLGIGLTLAKVLVDMHGGSISVADADTGPGTEFIVRLPLVPAESHSSGQDADTTASETTQQKILIVDDNVDAARSLKLLLRALGHEVADVYNGEAGVEQVIEFRPDLVLLDLGMPGMDGFETARRIREMPEGQNLILAALTGWGQDEIRERTRQAGFDFHFLKPLEIGALAEALSRGRMAINR